MPNLPQDARSLVLLRASGRLRQVQSAARGEPYSIRFRIGSLKKVLSYAPR